MSVIIIFVIALILMMGRKRTVAAAAALVLIFSSALPAYSSLLPDSEEWMTPWEAYGINKDVQSGYLELIQAMDASPPVSAPSSTSVWPPTPCIWPGR